MTLNDLIERLKKIRDEHGGELPVLYYNIDWGDVCLTLEMIEMKIIDKELKRVVIG